MSEVLFLRGENLYYYVDGRIVKSEIKKEKGIITSVIPFSDVYHINFKLPLNLTEEEKLLEAEKYMFSEGGLDLEKRYKINYYFQELNDSLYVDAFAVDEEVLEKRFKPYIDIFKYIDFISLSPFVFKEYYEISKIPPQVDAFVYFDEEDAYVSCFREGEFVFVKALNKFANLVKETGIDEKRLIEILAEKGLDESKYESYDLYNSINNFFSQFFMRMNNILNYAVNFYGLEKINRIFFYTPLKIHYFFESFKDFWNLSGIEFKKYEIESEYDSFDVTATLFNAKHYEDESLNYTIFHKPPPFYKTEFGKISILFAVLLLAVVVDASYKYYQISNLEKEINKLSVEKKKKEILLLKIKKKIKEYKEKISKLKEENNFYSSKIANIQKSVEYLYTIDKSEPFSNEMADMIKLLKINHLKVKGFSKVDNNFSIEIYGKGYKIANFLKDLSKNGYKNILIESIKRNINENYKLVNININSQEGSKEIKDNSKNYFAKVKFAK